MAFIDWYFEMKIDGLTDKEIASLMGVSRSTITNRKKMYGIPDQPRVRKNKQGLSQKELKIADENGIGRRVALQRVREYGWSNECAIRGSKGVKKQNAGKTHHEIQLEKSVARHEYYVRKKNKDSEKVVE